MDEAETREICKHGLIVDMTGKGRIGHMEGIRAGI